MKKIFYILIISLLPLAMTAQQAAGDGGDADYYGNELAVKPFDDKVWETAKEGIDYTPPEIKEKKKKEEEANNSGSSGSSGNNTSTRPRRNRNYSGWDWDLGEGGFSGFFKVLLIILLVGVIAFLVFRLAGGSFEIQPREKEGPTGPITNANIGRIEENLHKSDMEILIDKTLAEGNYMMVVRLYYLWAIKELSQKRFIKWKRDKTNRDYLREMRKTDLHKPFRNVTGIFEQVWYGNRAELGKEDFKELEPQFKDFISQVKRR